MSRRASVPAPVAVSIIVSVVALAAAVVVAGLALLVTGRRADDICEMPQAITVPEGAWFLAGDFRGESDDSRFWGRSPRRRSRASSSTATGR